VSGSKDLAVSGQIQLSISTLGTSGCSAFWQSRVVGYSLLVVCLKRLSAFSHQLSAILKRFALLV